MQVAMKLHLTELDLCSSLNLKQNPDSESKMDSLTSEAQGLCPQSVEFVLSPYIPVAVTMVETYPSSAYLSNHF